MENVGKLGGTKAYIQWKPTAFPSGKKTAGSPTYPNNTVKCKHKHWVLLSLNFKAQTKAVIL